MDFQEHNILDLNIQLAELIQYVTIMYLALRYIYIYISENQDGGNVIKVGINHYQNFLDGSGL